MTSSSSPSTATRRRRQPRQAAEGSAPANHGAACPAAHDLVIGEVVDVAAQGVRVSLPALAAQAPREVRLASALFAVSASDVGQRVAILFEGGDPSRPVAVGRIMAELPSRPISTRGDDRAPRRATLEATDSLVFRCGDAQIELRGDGRIALTGKYVLSRASGTNRILGGSVEIN